MIDDESLFKVKLIDYVSDTIISFDLNYNIISWNKAAEKLYGWKAQEVIGKSSYDVVPVEFPYDTLEDVLKDLSEKGFWSGEGIQYHKNGSRLNILSSSVIIKDDEGNSKFIVTINKDITKRKKAQEKLIESEEKWRSITKYTPDHILMMDKDVKILFINYTVPDLSIDQVIGRPIFDFVPKEYHELHRNVYDELLNNGEPHRFETGYVDKDGKQFYFEVNSGPVWKEGKIIGIINRSTDITGRKITEQKLIESEERLKNLNDELEQKIRERTEELRISEEKFRGFLDYGNIGMAITSVDKKWIYCNDQICEILGYTREDLFEKTWTDITYPEDLQSDVEQYNKVLDGKNDAYQIDKRFIKKNGEIIFTHSTVSCIRNSDRTVKYILATLQNITGRKMAEQKLKESEEKYRLIMENVNDLIAVLDTNLKYKFVNRGYELLGYSKEEILKSQATDILHPDDIKRATKAFSKGLKTGTGSEELRVKHKDGHYSWFEVKGKTYKDASGELNALLISRDITERKKVENELKDISEIKSEFLRRASHELKTPLISIKGFSDLILTLYKEELNPDIISKIEEINNGCERLQNIINNLLHTSKLESTDIKPKFEREDLSFLINFCVDELHPLAAKREHSLNIEIQDSIIIRFEKEEIHDVISNLLMNAIKYTPPPGWINIKTELTVDLVIVSIEDNGIGFTEEEKSKIFQQFGKIERYGQGFDLGIDGTGLGLYISKRIVESHGGKIWMESEGKDKGSTFHFSLPLIRDKI